MRAKDRSLDWITFSLYLALVAIGWAMIYTVGYGMGYPADFFEFLNTQVGKQLIWVVVSIGLFFLAYTIDWKFWRNVANSIYIVSLLSLVAVLIFGKTINGSTSWFDFGGGITLQPSSLPNLALVWLWPAILAHMPTASNLSKRNSTPSPFFWLR